MPAVRTLKLGDQVMRVIAARIINGDLAAEQSAPSEQELCREFEVSKTVAREVIARLAGLGLIEIRHGRRPQVLPRTAWNLLDPTILELQEDVGGVQRVVAEMHAIRMILEPEIAALAAKKIDERGIAALRECLEMMEAAHDFSEVLDWDLQFHLLLADATDNEVLIHIMKTLRQLMSISVRRRAEFALSAMSATPDWHRIIFDAVARGDAEAARDAMHEHILITSELWQSDMSGISA